MRFSLVASALLSLCTTTTVAQASSSTASAQPSTPTAAIAGNYIVEFADEKQSVTSFYEDLAAEGLSVEARTELRSSLFNGVSFHVHNVSSTGTDAVALLRQLEASKSVKSVWPVRPVQLKMPVSSEPPARDTEASANRRRHVSRAATTKEDTFSPHVMTQVSKLRAEGITGKGIRVAIIDSGIDYTHPALGGCFGEGCLVETGWDFTGDDFLPGTIEAKPDDDPMDDCQGHGTHVAGSVAAQLEGNEYGFTGAAPGVKLAAYRAWGCRATSTNEIIIAAFIKAFEDGADIISHSDGDASGWLDDARAVVASRIVDAGVPVIVAAGNDGLAGLFYPSTPAAARGVAGAGAVMNTEYPVFLTAGTYSIDASRNSSSSDNPSSHDFGFLPGYPEFSQNVSLALWSAVDSDNACKELPESLDLTDKVVLLQSVDARKTGCYPPDQGANVVAKGGKYLLYYVANDNTTMRDDIYNYAQGLQGVASVAYNIADQWIAQLDAGHTVTVSIPNSNSSTTVLESLENNSNGGYVADLSSWGPTWEIGFSTDVVAPGANILSLFPTAMGSYRVMTGTSMSAPLVAGIYALLSEARGTKDPSVLGRLLASTAKPLAWFDGSKAYPDLTAPPPQQGAGIAQVYDAAHAVAELDVINMSFNDTDNFEGEQTFTVTNTGDEDLDFEVGHSKSPTMYFLQDGDVMYPMTFPNPTVAESATLEFSSSKVNVPAGASTNVTVTCTPPENVEAKRLAVYSGHITLNSTSQSLVLPYVGVVGSMKSTPVLYGSKVYLANYNSAVPANKTYTIPRPDPESPPATDKGDEGSSANILIQPTIGSSEIHVDVLKDGKVLGPLAGWPVLYAARVPVRAYFNGLLDDGTVLDEGTYRVRVKALRVLGDKKKEEDWDVVTSVPFSIKYEA